MNLKPLKKNLILRTSVSAIVTGTDLVIPERYMSANNTCMVVSRGSNVNPHIQEGCFVLFDNDVQAKRRIVNKQDASIDFVCHEKNILGLVVGQAGREKKLIPLGDWVLFERFKGEEAEESGIITKLETRNYQSLKGWARAVGLMAPGRSRKVEININSDLSINDSYEILSGWREHMKEFSYQGKHYLLVRSNDIACTCTRL